MKHMKRIFAILLASLMAALLFAACGNKTKPAGADKTLPSQEVSPVELPAQGAALEVWEGICGTYTRNDSSQYNNAVLMLKYLDNSCAMFEFRLMEGSESEDEAHDLILPFVCLIDDNGIGQYESDPDAKRKLKISLALSEDGQTVTVASTGESLIFPDGIYEYTEDGVEVSETSAAAILEHLPPAVTSLNESNRPYNLVYNEERIADWFYQMDALFGETVIGKFLVAQDMSAVYRVDDDIEPMLIYGSAQPMLDYERPVSVEYDESGDADAPEADVEFLPLASVGIDGGLLLQEDETRALTAELPWALPYTFDALKSSDTKVVTVKDGKVTAAGTGTAKISGKLIVDDAEKDFALEVTVFALWWGQYKTEDGKQLGISNFDGDSFRFGFSGPGGEDDGMAAVEPDDPSAAEMLPYNFVSNSEDHITVTGGDFAGEYFWFDPEEAAG